MTAEPGRRSAGEALAGPAYRRLFAAVRERLERDGERAQSVTLKDLSLEERTALADLLGRARLPEATLRLRLDHLDAALRRIPPGKGLVEVVEALGGPLVDRAAVARARREGWERVWEGAASHPTVRERPELVGWLDEVRRLGLVKRKGARGPRVLAQALEAISVLPHAEGIARGVLAARVAGDAHALDEGRTLAALVLRAARCLAGWEMLPEGAADRRRLWGEVGVLCDGLSSHVLVLGWRPVGGGWLAEQLRASAAAGEPRRVTLRELRQGAPSPGAPVSICENPVVVERAADRHGCRCAPLVCTDGVPSVAVWRLLAPLSRAGIGLRFHADFDWAGLRIAARLHERLGGTPWRFGVADYLAALDGSEARALAGPPVGSPWEPALAEAMSERGLAVHEELVLEDLLADLG